MSDQAFKFASGADMLDALRTTDLYSPTLEAYVFQYSEDGAIAQYHITKDRALELAELSSRHGGEYWGAFLGTGGWIYDDPSDEYFKPSAGCSNIDYCNSVYTEVWIDTEDVRNIERGECYETNQ